MGLIYVFKNQFTYSLAHSRVSAVVSSYRVSRVSFQVVAVQFAGLIVSFQGS